MHRMSSNRDTTAFAPGATERGRRIAVLALRPPGMGFALGPGVTLREASMRTAACIFAAAGLLGVTAPAARAQYPQRREGFWIGFGLGYGTANVTCDTCVSGSDRKSTRLNSSHQIISYAVFCLKKKKTVS